MPNKITLELKEFIEGPVGISIGTRSSELIPEYCRVLGAHVLENDFIKFFIAKSTVGETINNIKDNKLISINFASPLSSESYQFKGENIKFTDCDETGQKRVDEYMSAFNDYLLKIGLSDGLIYKWPSNPCIAIEMKVEDIFDQSPKIGAGNKITT